VYSRNMHTRQLFFVNVTCLFFEKLSNHGPCSVDGVCIH
jgi:hypothetical protein